MNYLNIKDEKLLPVVVELNTLLADYHIYYQKLRNFHWNILGENFFDLHNKFEELYTDARTKIDEIAERILTLRYHPMSKLSDYLELSAIKEVSPIQSDKEMVAEILNDHQLLLKQMKAVVNKAEAATDEGTIDLIGAYIRELEKASWMLDSWSKKPTEHLNRAIVE
ncbi:Dps family protein [Formosa algae]|uniref:Starvation-inducible DNA-binding protein n=1 Tax=Formosa algae TaxID=225843 RepID=A0A9X0YLQ9_9FLAO|nr:DNA starvation/stationary phase protection protein [Formosa algae]MBP1840895.1 starvation-inducible DNA-binding protein [Formosa algae]MDQ0336208.1 starvation-inducible DNA-binding protein [Formosa algae]OEI79981.1 DNA starvation/stationary phase protection protein [Formosa algae]PNW28321.1 DNA starvation/stationary phase protection protein [Formosa algae]